jgi:hypothetical protein
VIGRRQPSAEPRSSSYVLRRLAVPGRDVINFYLELPLALEVVLREVEQEVAPPHLDRVLREPLGDQGIQVRVYELLDLLSREGHQLVGVLPPGEAHKPREYLGVARHAGVRAGPIPGALPLEVAQHVVHARVLALPAVDFQRYQRS